MQTFDDLSVGNLSGFRKDLVKSKSDSGRVTNVSPFGWQNVRHFTALSDFPYSLISLKFGMGSLTYSCSCTNWVLLKDLAVILTELFINLQEWKTFYMYLSFCKSDALPHYLKKKRQKREKSTRALHIQVQYF